MSEKALKMSAIKKKNWRVMFGRQNKIKVKKIIIYDIIFLSVKRFDGLLIFITVFQPK